MNIEGAQNELTNRGGLRESQNANHRRPAQLKGEN